MKGTFSDIVLIVCKKPREDVNEQISKMIPINFAREIKFLKQISHKHIIQYYGNVGEHIFLQYAALGDVWQYIKNNDHKDIWFKQIASAIDYIHDQKFFHGDIKPQNILLINSEYAILSDFGSSGKIGVDLYCGTFNYFHPKALNEIQLNQEMYDNYAFGLTIWSIIGKSEPPDNNIYQPMKNSNKNLIIQVRNHIDIIHMNSDKYKLIITNLLKDYKQEISILLSSRAHTTQTQ